MQFFRVMVLSRNAVWYRRSDIFPSGYGIRERSSITILGFSSRNSVGYSVINFSRPRSAGG